MDTFLAEYSTGEVIIAVLLLAAVYWKIVHPWVQGRIKGEKVHTDLSRVDKWIRDHENECEERHKVVHEIHHALTRVSAHTENAHDWIKLHEKGCKARDELLHSRISSVKDDVGEVKTRIAVVESKLDMLIQGKKE